jgi:hypothetical protein
MGRTAPRLSKAAHPLFLETQSMFKKLIPVIALALIAGPVLAADPPASGSDQSSSTSGKSHHGKGKHHGSKSGSKSSHKPASGSSGDTSNAPAK